MTRVGFAEAYYDAFTGAQQSMSMLATQATNVNPILITPKDGQCSDRMESKRVQKAVIEYPDRLDQFGGKLIEGGPFHKGAVTLTLLRYYFYVLKELNNLNLDILYCNNLRSLLLFGPPAKVLGVPIIWYVRIDTPSPTFDGIAFRLADVIVTISNGVRQRFEESLVAKNEDRIRTIYTGVNLERFDPAKSYVPPYDLVENSLTIVEVASIHPRKGQERLIRAIAEVQDELPKFQVVFAGSVVEGQETYAKNLGKLVEKFGLNDKVDFIGWCEDVPALLSHADIFVLPSSNEGLPRSILEASAMEVPTIATPAGGTTELLRDGETGLVVSMVDDKELSRAIRKLATNPELRDLYGSNARSLVRTQFSQSRYVSEFEQLIEDIKSNR